MLQDFSKAGKIPFRAQSSGKHKSRPFINLTLSFTFYLVTVGLSFGQQFPDYLTFELIQSDKLENLFSIETENKTADTYVKEVDTHTKHTGSDVHESSISYEPLILTLDAEDVAGSTELISYFGSVEDGVDRIGGSSKNRTMISEGKVNSFAGGNGTSENPFQITNWIELNNVRDFLDSHFQLMNDLTPSTEGYNDLASGTANGGKGWDPIGYIASSPAETATVYAFEGTFNGNGKSINGLNIERVDESSVGLFSFIYESGKVQNLGLKVIEVLGGNRVGGLAGYNQGEVANSFVEGSVRSFYDPSSEVGGLIGYNEVGGIVSESYTTGNVRGFEDVGGLIGNNSGSVFQSYSSTNVTSSNFNNTDGNTYFHDFVGGLVGKNKGTVRHSHATGNITGKDYVGGLIGLADGGIVSHSYATGNVTGGLHIGGLVGYIASTVKISNSYAKGEIIGRRNVGGLVGFIQTFGSITYSYATGKSTATELFIGILDVGGLVGKASSSSNITYSFWDKQSTGHSESSFGGQGKTTEEMKSLATFSDVGWEFPDTWHIDEVNETSDNEGYPSLAWQGLAHNPNPFAGGNGTSDNPFQITNWTELNRVRDFLDSHFQLMNDLTPSKEGYNDLASGTANGGKGWDPIGGIKNNELEGFKGFFNGAGKRIHDLSIIRDEENHVGLFGFIDEGGKVQDLGLVDVDIKGLNIVGGLVGENHGEVKNSYVIGIVTGANKVGGLVGVSYKGIINSSHANGGVKGVAFVGGLVGNFVGNSEIGMISNSYATSLVMGDRKVGGLVGWSYFASINNSYAIGAVKGGLEVGGLVGEGTSGKISNSYAAGAVSGNGSLGGLLGSVNQVAPTITGSFWDKEATGQQISAAGGEGKTKEEMKSLATFSDAGWDLTENTGVWEIKQGVMISYPYLQAFTYDEPGSEPEFNPIPGLQSLYSGGEGTESSPYQIKNWEDLHNVRYNLDAFFELQNNLDETISGYLDYVKNGEDLVDDGKGWDPIGGIKNNELEGFKGFFNGAGKRIHDLSIIRDEENHVGLFGFIDEGGKVQDLGLVDVDIKGLNLVGGLVGENRGEVKNSYVIGNVSGESQVGGFVGSLYSGTVRNSYASGSVSGEYSLGGLVGYNSYGTISNSYAKVVVSGNLRLGGLVGEGTSGKISNSYAAGAVSGNGSLGGLLGIVNQVAPTITGSFWDKEATGQQISAAGGEGKTKEEMKSLATFSDAGWEFPDTWHIDEVNETSDNEGYPSLAWQGLAYIPQLFAGGNGTSDNPFQITNWTELSRVSDFLDSHFKLKNDLTPSTEGYDDLASSTANGGKGWDPIGDLLNRFNGTFNGADHILYGLSITRAEEQFVGLFSLIESSGKVQDLGLVDVDIKGLDLVGGLVGRNQGEVKNSYVIGNISGELNLGGLVGSNNGTVSNSYASGSVSGESSLGGLVGSNIFGTISNSYATGSVSGNLHLGGLVGSIAGGTISNSYAMGAVSGNGSMGGLLGNVGAETPTVTASFWDKESTGQQSSSAGGEGKTTEEMKSLATFSDAGWDFTESTGGWEIKQEGMISYPYLQAFIYDEPGTEPEVNPIPGLQSRYSGGEGTESNPYQIKNWEQLYNVRYNLDAFFELQNNLDETSSGYLDYVKNGENLVDDGKGWDPIGDLLNGFNGTFNGNDHIIHGLTIIRDKENYVGLFGYTKSNGKVLNVKLVGVDIKGDMYVGGLVGYNIGEVKNSYVTGGIIGSKYVGGLVGYIYNSEISNSFSTGSVTGSEIVGGLVGFGFISEISNSYSTCIVTGGDYYVGGLVGYLANASVSNSYSTGSVSGQNYLGGLVGYSLQSIVNNSFSTGSITGSVSVGGLVGDDDDSEISNSFWDKETSGQDQSAGGHGKTTEELKSLNTFSPTLDPDGWDFVNVWAINPTGWISYPYLKALDYDSPGETPEYNPIPGLEQRLENTIEFAQFQDVVYGIVPFDAGATATSGDQVTYTSSNTDVADIENNLIVIKGVGETTITATLVNVFGYSDAIPVSQELKVLPKSISVEGIVVENKFYDGTAIASILGTANLEGVVGQDDVALSGEPVFTFEQANAGENINVLVTGWTLTGKSAINYTLKLPSLTGTIDKASLTITADDKQKTYGEENPALSFSYTGLVNGDTQVSSEPIISTTAIAASNVGTYPITLSGGSDDNYEIELKAGTLTIGKKSLTITADDKQKTYGEENPALTFSYSGLVNGDTKVATEPSIKTTTTASSNVGTYPITLTGGSDDNYDIELKAGILTVGKAKVIITADNKQKTYGEANPALTFSYSGLVNGDTELSTEPSIRTTATAASDVGTYPITLSGGSDGNYDIELKAGTMTIGKKALTITADDKQKIYGEENPPLTFSYAGLVNGDTKVSSEPSIATTATAASDVGTYPITLSGGSDDNYEIELKPGTMTIGKKALTITADDKQKTYGEENPALTFIYTGLVNGDTKVSIEPSIATSATVASNVGTYPITLSGGSDGNYEIELKAGTLTVGKNSLTITADDMQKTYGEENPALTFIYTGLVNGDTKVSIEPSISTTATAASDVGTYPITLSGGSDGNYDIELKAGTLTVGKKSLTITADDKQKIYGEENPPLTFSYAGLVNGDTKVSSEPSIATTATVASNVGTYPITLSGGSDDNYEIELKAGTLTIGKKSLMITADDKQKTYGEENPALTFSYTGLVNGDTKVSSEPIIATSATAASNVGTYPITLSSGSDDNYEIELKNGTLTVGKVKVIITADNKQKTYGEANPALTFTYSGLVNGDTKVATEPSIKTTTTASSNVGTYPITLTGAADANYDITLVNGILTVGQKAVTITVEDKNKVYGEVNPNLTFTYTGLVNGDEKVATEPSIATSATASSNVGTYPITLTGAADANYDITLVAGQLEVTQATLTITANEGQSKIFGTADPVLSYSATGFAAGDDEQVLTGTLTRGVGEVVGIYPINLGSLAAGGNYQIVYASADFEIIPAVIEAVMQPAPIETVWGVYPGLPSTVTVMTTDGQFLSLPITWDLQTLYVFGNGEYPLTASINLPSGILNTEELTVEIVVTVLPKPAPEDILLDNNSFEAEAGQNFIAVGNLTVIDPIDNQNDISLADLAFDNVYFQINNGTLFWNSEERADGRTTFKILVRVQDRDGNILEKEFTVIRNRTSVSNIEIFNSFTPNGDNVNDTWGVEELRFYKGVRVQVFERSGKRLFYTESPDIRWDGTFNGKELPIGTYYWTIEVRETGEVRKGMLNLLRK